MTHLTPVPNADAAEESPQAAANAVPPKSRRSGKVLPSDRISFPRQLEILRGFSVAAADAGGTASSNQVGPLISMSHHTINISTPFFASVGLLNRADRGRFAPAAEVTDYSRAHQWTPDTAAHRLAPIIRKAWFGKLISRMVSVQARSVEDILTDLAGESGADPSNRPQLELLIDFAIAGGLVVRDGAMLRQALPTTRASDAVAEAEVVGDQPPPAVASDVPAVGMVSNFRKDNTEGMVSFDVSVRVNMSEFADWRPERISAFFGGIASVLAAKGRMEEDAGSES